MTTRQDDVSDLSMDAKCRVRERRNRRSKQALKALALQSKRPTRAPRKQLVGSRSLTHASPPLNAKKAREMAMTDRRNRNYHLDKFRSELQSVEEEGEEDENEVQEQDEMPDGEEDKMAKVFNNLSLGGSQQNQVLRGDGIFLPMSDIFADHMESLDVHRPPAENNTPQSSTVSTYLGVTSWVSEEERSTYGIPTRAHQAATGLGATSWVSEGEEYVYGISSTPHISKTNPVHAPIDYSMHDDEEAYFFSRGYHN